MSHLRKMTQVNKMEKWQKLTAGLNPNHMHIFKPWKKDVQSCIKISMKLYTELRLQGTHCLYFHRIWGQKMTKFTKWKKWQKLIQGLYPNHMHISRPWRNHVQSLKKMGIKLYEELRSQGTHCLYRAQPRGQSGINSPHKLADFSLFWAEGEVKMYRTYREIQILDQNFS